VCPEVAVGIPLVTWSTLSTCMANKLFRSLVSWFQGEK
jgi:hypothetical protein